MTEAKTIKTRPLIEQIKASREIYRKALEILESLTDSELRITLAGTAPTDASAATVDRVLSIASDDTMARLASLRSLVVPIVPDIDKQILAHAEAGKLDMSTWHCGTAHCRAGWAVTLGGEAGRQLEERFGSAMAGRLIYEASTGRVAPDFYASNETALADLRRCAAL